MRHMVFRYLLALGLLALNTAAHASCDAAAKFDFRFASQPTTTLNYANSYTYAATNGLAQSSNVTVSFQTYNVASSLILLSQFPQISNTVANSATSGNFLVIGGSFASRTPNITANANVIVTTLTFATPVRDVTISVSDVDQSSVQFRDWLYVVGKNGSNNYAPTITTPFGQSNGGTLTNPSSKLTLGPTSSPFAVGAQEAVGTGTNTYQTAGGDITLSFTQPVTSIDLRLGNYPLQSGELLTGSQLLGIGGLSFCPMPVLQVSKTSTPYVTTAGNPLRFAAPGADMIYAVTVTNAGNSPVDLSTIVLSDPLPAQVAFYNGDIDDSGPLTTNFEFIAGSSGMTMTSANLGYSSNGGSSYAYSPAAGYDASVNAVRFAPTGMLASNSSFTIRFRTRIK
jgi:uncharacterized repeat protein (TIGR01451 family)